MYVCGFEMHTLQFSKTVHDGEKPIKCMFCGFKMHTLQFSKTLHDGEKPCQMYVLRFSFILKHLSNVCFVDLFHFEAVLKERKLKNVHFVVSQRVHDGKKTVKCMFCCFVKIMLGNESEKNLQINYRLRSGGTKYCRLWGFTVVTCLQRELLKISK